MPTPPLSAAERFSREALARLGQLLDAQRDALDRAAALCTDAIAAGGLVHLFGCGHSRMMCEEMTPRQGCFVGWHTLVELGLTYHNPIVGANGLRQSLHLEKTPGYAEQILRNFAFGPKDVLIVISTSGIREVIVEMAEAAKRRGLAVIGVLSREHCERAKPAHPSGKKLIDLADVVLDNGAPYGDAVLDAAGTAVCAVSSITAALLAQMVVAEVVRTMLAAGETPPVYLSANVPGGDAHNTELEARYAGRIRRPA